MDKDAVAKNNARHKFGQYFTPEVVAEFMIGLAELTKHSAILEPCCGEGIFLKLLRHKGYRHVSAFEIDRELAKDCSNVRYESFISAIIKERFDLVIGNPPYIRWKNLEEELKQELSIHPTWDKYFNSLCDYLYIFILKSIELLHEGGQLIFICPEYWMNTTHSLSLRNYMVENGYFEAIYHFNETPVFDKVTLSIVIFKFIKSKQSKEKIKVVKFNAYQRLTAEILSLLQQQQPIKGVTYLTVSPFKANERWLLQPDTVKEELKILETNCLKKIQDSSLPHHGAVFNTIGDICDIGNGLVSGLDKAFRLREATLNEAEKQATIKVVKAKDLKPFRTTGITPYIFVENGLEEPDFEQRYPNFYTHFQDYKTALRKRYQYNRKINYWEWVMLRNFNLFRRKEPRIFVPCKERISNKGHFRFALVAEDIFPTQDVTALFKKEGTSESIEYIAAYLNNPVIFNWMKCNGIVKGNIVTFSEQPVASIPFRMIDRDNDREVQLHDRITLKTQEFIAGKQGNHQEEINQLFDQLFDQDKKPEKIKKHTLDSVTAAPAPGHDSGKRISGAKRKTIKQI